MGQLNTRDSVHPHPTPKDYTLFLLWMQQFLSFSSQYQNNAILVISNEMCEIYSNWTFYSTYSSITNQSDYGGLSWFI